MGYKTGIERKQLTLLPESLEDYVPSAHICRLINVFTEQLDMAVLGYRYAECKDTGCRPYDPRMMLNLYVYGYLHRVRSSRRLRDETTRNVEVMWLMEGLKPDDKTISNFRRDNAEALKKTFREFSRMCQEFKLYGGEVIATDSVKIRANNALDNNHNKTTVGNALTKIDREIDKYMKALEEGDRKEEGVIQPSPVEIEAALQRLRMRRNKYEALKARLEKESEVSTVDPDARLMRTGGEGRRLDVCYNVQTAVDSKHHLIVDFEVTGCSSDAGNLKSMSDKAMEIMRVKTITNLADSGYYDSKDIVACEQSGVTCLVAKPATGGPKKEEGFNRKDFSYVRERDVYKCPCQKELTFMSYRKHISGREYRMYANHAACGICRQKKKCTSLKYREILRLNCQDVLDHVDERVRKNKVLYHKRQEIVEHCFGTIKAVWGYRQYLCRTKVKVAAETALAYMAYNLRRIFNVYTENEVRLAMVCE